MCILLCFVSTVANGSADPRLLVQGRRVIVTGLSRHSGSLRLCTYNMYVASICLCTRYYILLIASLHRY